MRSSASQNRSMNQPRRRVAAQNSPHLTDDMLMASIYHDHGEPAASSFRKRQSQNQLQPSSSSIFSFIGRGAASSGPASPDENGSQPLPPLSEIASDLCIYCSLYMKHLARKFRSPLRRMEYLCSVVIGGALIIAFPLLLWLLCGFYKDATNVCTPPSDYEYSGRPLVEYYVHGRGIGHYARSVAIVDQLNDAGVDVRMFLSRAAMWRAMHESNGVHKKDDPNRGTTTAIPVTSITPNKEWVSTVSQSMERIIGDCEVAAHSKRYPTIVISDGDMPGMLRGKLGGIPTVSIAHGQLFNIAQKPAWISKNRNLNRGWNRQGLINGVASWFSQWQIATHFCTFESRRATGAVAKAPMRPEIVRMAATRARARLGDAETFGTIPQGEYVRQLLAGWNETRAFNYSSAAASAAVPTPRRKVVICYFRDRNGEAVTKALMAAGFDVLLFDNGYLKDVMTDPNRYGVKWIIHDKVDHDVKRTGKQISDEHRRKLLRKEKPRLAAPVSRDSLNSDGPRLIRILDRALFVPLMYIADGVASSAGSQLMSECIYSRMPLMAMFLETDDEQRLNVELSRHSDSSCNSHHVAGTSFEHFLSLLNANGTIFTPNSRDKGLVEAHKELQKFIDAVRTSKVSETYYRHLEGPINTGNSSSIVISHELDKEDDPFRGQPEPAEIILQIIHEVSNGNFDAGLA